MGTRNQVWRDLLRSWSQHTGVQVATLTVLTATFTVVACVLTASLNLQRVLDRWGESVNMTVYMHEAAKIEEVADVQAKLKALDVISEVSFVSKEEAKTNFETDLANILPNFMKDEEFGNPFPSSFELSLKEDVIKKNKTNLLDEVAQTITGYTAVDDVTYGQDWVKNYASVLAGVHNFGMILVAVMLLGGVLVIGNGLRSSIAQRREEIEILELVGATYSMIRRPYVVDGAVTGFASGITAIAVSFLVYELGVEALAGQMSFLSVQSEIQFLSFGWMGMVVLASTAFGFVGSYLSVRQINGGYAASKKVKC